MRTDLASGSAGAVPRVGIVGGGQLARMLAPAAVPLGVELILLAERRDDSAAQVIPQTSIGAPDLEALRSLARGCDVVTFDHELVNPTALSTLEAEGVPLAPRPGSLRMAQDKAHQRATLAAAGLPTPAHRRAATLDEARAAADELGWPVVVKAPEGGYDGRGVAIADDAADLPRAWQAVGSPMVLLEERVSLAAEIAVLVVRRPNGEEAVYPVVETVQEDGICTELVVPARVPAEVVDEARRVATAVAARVGAEGVCAVELFWTGQQVLVNEVATRPHNSGHWTIDGAVTSQFANHLRGVLDWPLGLTHPVAPAVATVNILGPADGSDPRARVPEALAVPGVAVHLYGKAARPGRKLGHVTTLGDDTEEALGRARAAAARLTGATP